MGDYPCRLPESRIDLAGDIAFETTDDFRLTYSLAGAATHIFPGLVVVTKPDQYDAIKSRIGLAVATPVQPVPVGLSGGSRYRIHPAQRGEGGLVAEALGIAPGSD